MLRDKLSVNKISLHFLEGVLLQFTFYYGIVMTKIEVMHRQLI
jgi:hypothetical protein